MNLSQIKKYLKNLFYKIIKKEPHFKKTYISNASEVLKNIDENKAMKLIIGGEFEAIGKLEYYLLLSEGLKKNHVIVDVGCGSGRLALQLVDFLEGKFIGIDIVPKLVNYARKSCNRPDWVFKTAAGLTIPAKDESVDFISFFSVFTHLTHEEIYKYLIDSKRVLKVDGKIIFSFLEFSMPSHWSFFENYVNDPNPNKVLNHLISRDAIKAMSEHLDLKIESIIDGTELHIPLPEPVKFENGHVFKDFGALGQSVCVLTKLQLSSESNTEDSAKTNS
ncbi:MAG: class I SAM-dependent methyltransferase [Bacteroidota bacterium]|nr:class I SAM-dependent methyltransferase [Bacteroidota bacterium]